MVSNVRYFSFKEIHIHRRQPFWVLLAVILALKLLIAEPQICLFTIFILYAASGPARSAVALRSSTRAARLGVSSLDIAPALF